MAAYGGRLTGSVRPLIVPSTVHLRHDGLAGAFMRLRVSRSPKRFHKFSRCCRVAFSGNAIFVRFLLAYKLETLHGQSIRTRTECERETFAISLFSHRIIFEFAQ